MNTMQHVSYNRIALIGGIGTMLLFPATTLIGWQRSPLSGSPDEVFAAYFVANQANVLVMALIVAFHSLTRLTFAAGLCGVLRQAEGGGATLTGLALACAAVEVAIEMVAFTVLSTGARLAGRDADPGVLGAIGSAAQDLMYMHGIPLALFAILASIVILRTGVLPRWLGWLGLAAGIVLEVSALDFAVSHEALGALSSIGAFLLFTPWMLATGVIMFRRAGRGFGEPPAQVETTA